MASYRLHSILLVSSILAVYRKLLFGIPYSYDKVNYFKTTSTNNFKIVPEDFLPDATS